MIGQQAEGQKPLFYSYTIDGPVPATHRLRGIDRFVDLHAFRRYLATN
jgi:hypothetical protein